MNCHIKTFCMNRISIGAVCSYVLFVLLLAGCKSSDIGNGRPKVVTEPILEIGEDFAIGGALIHQAGGGEILAQGLCWDTKPNPTINALGKTQESLSSGEFSSTMTGLSAGTTYYVRAYATNNTGTNYGYELNFKTMSKQTFEVGDEYGGGIVFYVDETGMHGLIAAFSDINNEEPVSWKITHNEEELAIAAYESGIGLGMNNTQRIIANQAPLDDGSGIYAAKLCREYQGGGYDDWYLPSAMELEALFANKEIVGGFVPEEYLSSTGNENEYWTCVTVHFDTGQVDLALTSDMQRVRAIRAF